VFGYLKSVEFQDGDFVKGPPLDANGKPIIGPDGKEQPGQTLFIIEPDEYLAIHNQSLARIELNQANLTLAKAKLARNEALVKSGAVSKEEYEESVAAVEAATAAITAARADAKRTEVDLKYTVVTAPISGRIDRAFVTKGNLLTGGQGSGTLLTKIVQENPMYVYFDVDERSLLRYMRQRTDNRDKAPGSLRERAIPCFLQLADEADFSHEGTLDFIATEVSRTTGTARIRGVFPNQDRSLASGLFVRVQIPVSQPYQALMIPELALATDQSIKFVFVVGADGTAERREVELGTTRGPLRIVTSGLKEGEHVIVKGLQRVKPGQKVEATLEKVEPPATSSLQPVTPMPTGESPAEPTPAPTARPTTPER
jgi:RND family efflux transporter MFP subunit